jgi:hypothetical protein
VRARCTKAWRGANFDAAAAQGNVGAAVAETLGMRVRTSQELEAFLRRALVKTFELPDERYEFHVGLREPLDAATLANLEGAVRDAVAKSRNFEVE